MGFRGEALPSIAAVSRMEMTTRARNRDTGVRLTVEGGENLAVREVGSPEGTTAIMRDLFFNLPVRRAFLKKPAYEAALVSDVVARMILGNPGVSFRYINNGRTIYHSFGDGELRHAVFAVYGRETAEKMRAVDRYEGGIRVRRPHWHRRAGQDEPRPRGFLYQRPQCALVPCFRRRSRASAGARDGGHVSHVRAASHASAIQR